MVHTLNMVQLSVVPDDRRERRRDLRRQRFLDAAGRIVDRDGLSGVTMQAIADELDCAIGTIYTYFPSKAALLSALTEEAITTLQASYLAARQSWDGFLETEALEPDVVPLVQVLAYGSFLAAAAVVYADEMALQRSLLAGQGGSVEPEVVRRLLENPRQVLSAAAEAGVVDPGEPVERALRWITALQAVLMLDRLASLDRHLFRATHQARALTADLLVGWGADRVQVEVAAAEVERLAALGPLAPPVV